MKHILLLLLLLPLSSMAQRGLKPSEIDPGEIYIYVGPTGKLGKIMNDSVCVAMVAIKSTKERVQVPLPINLCRCLKPGREMYLSSPQLPLP